MPPLRRCLDCKALHSERTSRCRSCELAHQRQRNARRVHYQGDYRKRRDQLVQLAMLTDERCSICGEAIDYGAQSPSPLAPTADHVRAGDPASPLRIAHARCNSSRGDRPA